VAPGPAPEAAAEPVPSAVSSGAAPAVPAANGETGTTAGADTGSDSDSDGENAPEGTPGSGTQASSDAEGLAAAAAAAAPAPRSGPRPARRLSKPMIAAAATSGVVLMGVPLVLSQLGGGSGPDPVPPRPAGYNQADGGPDGFVPRADTPEKGSSAARKGPLSGVGTGVGVGVAAAPTPTSVQAPGTGPGAAHSGPGPTAAPARPGDTTFTPKTPATQAPAAPAKPQYSAVAGPNCASTCASFTYSGWYTDGKEGWQKYGSGGYAGGGCNGGFLSLPMSGKAGSDAGNSLRWTFRTGAVTSGTCQVSVHIPSNTDIKAVGGKPSYYTVHAGTTGSDPILRTFNVNQPSLRGQWVSAGGVRITGGVLTVKLHDRGLDWSGSRKTYAHHAGDAARVQCTAD
jgi:translation initiation factor IF-2